MYKRQLKHKSDKSILHRCISPREAWDALLAWYDPQTAGAKSDLSRRLNRFKVAPRSNPLEEMGRIEDLAAEMTTAGLVLENHMIYNDHILYTIFIHALPAKYEVEARILASRESIGRQEIIKAVRERHHRLSGNRKRGSNCGHALYAGDGGGRGKSGGRGNGKGRRRGKNGQGGRGTNEDGGGSAAAAGFDSSSAKATEGSIPARGCLSLIHI